MGLTREQVLNLVNAVNAGDQPSANPDSTPRETFTAKQWGEHILEGLSRKDETAIPLPWQPLSEALDGGFRPGEYILVGGWTNHGKSPVVDQIADTAVGAGFSTHLYMSEMSAYERGLRMIARRTGVSITTLRRRDLTQQQWRAVINEVQMLPHGCTIVAGWKIQDLAEDIRKNKWQLAIIDLLHGFHYRDERDLSEVSQTLRNTAKLSTTEHTGTAIVSAVHLNDGQMRDTKTVQRVRPGLHSIKGSSSLKQDADYVLFVWQEDDEQGNPSGKGAIWIGKARNGQGKSIPVTLDTRRLTFEIDEGGR